MDAWTNKKVHNLKCVLSQEIWCLKQFMCNKKPSLMTYSDFTTTRMWKLRGRGFQIISTQQFLSYLFWKWNILISWLANISPLQKSWIISQKSIIMNNFLSNFLILLSYICITCVCIGPKFCEALVLNHILCTTCFIMHILCSMLINQLTNQLHSSLLRIIASQSLTTESRS